jgi:hypothetical protein
MQSFSESARRAKSSLKIVGKKKLFKSFGAGLKYF